MLRWNGDGTAKPTFSRAANIGGTIEPGAKSTKDIPGILKSGKGIPNDIDAAFQWKNGRSYFFKGDKYYAFDDNRVKVLEDSRNPYPRDVATYWMGCTNPEVNIDPVGSGTTYGMLPNVLIFIACFFITWLF